MDQVEGPLGWRQFERAAPELAALGKERIDDFGFVFIATSSHDNSPRLSAVEAYVVEEHLVVNMMSKSYKAKDLLRDGRCMVHTPIVDREGRPGEFKARGEARVIAPGALWDAVADHIERKIEWRPPKRSHSFIVLIERAAFITYDDAGTQRVLRWRVGKSLMKEAVPLDQQ
jgi:hypothetical protein